MVFARGKIQSIVLVFQWCKISLQIQIAQNHISPTIFDQQFKDLLLKSDNIFQAAKRIRKYIIIQSTFLACKLLFLEAYESSAVLKLFQAIKM